MTKFLQSRYGGLYVFGAVFVIVSLLLRTVLYIHTSASIDFGLWTLAKIYLVGLFFDVITYFCLVSPVAILFLFAPDRLYRWKFHRYLAVGLYFVAIYVMLFDVAAEYLFWDEFGSRFNFVAVDYLIYTNEIIGNILESYPVPAILGGLLVGAVLILIFTRRPLLRTFEAPSSFRQRLAPGLVYVAVPALSLLLVDQSLANITKNQYSNELARNGVYSLVTAFKDNTLEYDRFYVTEDDRAALARLKGLLKADNARFVSDDPLDIMREVTYPGPERRHNVVILTVESLSTEYMGVFGNALGLTPNLDALAKDSLFFRNFYATGTRTDRGLEAIALSIPPTPGRSLLKRPDNENLFSVGPIFRRRGYRTQFIYGGFNRFDNMDNFFKGNGFDSMERSDFQPEEITFSNAWGVCDEDLLNRTLTECDRSAADGKPFFFIVMTTSNHRPYTYPQKIDIPSGKGRNGGVKYTDYAIGDFLTQARTRRWFDDTVFVIVADHCANSAGKVEVPVEHYHIPLLIYAPKIVQPREVDKLSGQMDLAPTLLGLLQFSCKSKFIGRDILQPGPGVAVMGNYQKVGLYRDGKLVLLLPKRQCRFYQVGQEGQNETAKDEQLLQDAIAYYQSASYLLRHHLYSAD